MGKTNISWDHVTIIDQKTGETVGTLNPQSPVEVTWCSEDTSPIEIGNSYCFKCDLKQYYPELPLKLKQSSAAYKTAERLADRLNDLIEEYHAPGTPRRERRAIKREFQKILRIFQKHCNAHNIKISFTKS